MGKRLAEKISQILRTFRNPFASPNEDKHRYGPDSKHQQRNWPKALNTQVVKVGECVLCGVNRVVVDQDLLADLQFIGPGTLPPCIRFAVHIEGVSVLIVIREVMCSDDSLSCLLPLGNRVIGFPAVNTKN